MSSIHPRSLIPFAHRGGKADFRENTLDAFRNAIGMGISGIETDVWLTSDDVPVLDHDGVVKTWMGLRRRKISKFRRSELPQWIPTLAELYELCDEHMFVCVDIKGGKDCAQRVVEVARRAGSGATKRLYLAHAGYRESNWRLVSSWRSLDPDVHLVDSTAPRRFDIPAGVYAKRALDAGVDVVNMRGRHWNVSLIEQFHAEGLQCFAFGVQRTEAMQRLAQMGIDGIHSDHPKRLMRALSERGPSPKAT